MKKSLRFGILTFFMMLITGCASGEDNGSTSDPIIGKWKMVSETKDGNPTKLSACDLMGTFEFTSSGRNNNITYQTENGDCVMVVNSGVVVKWINVVKDNYRFKAYQNGQKLYDLDVQTYFSNNNKTLVMTSLDSKNAAKITTLEKIDN
ncbi:hypothetical protein [Flavobacterium sp. 3HN19-14]|uniref:hypothetical protein n=1 Tax=Flavobacterium sp. 3HN19-14 TaxID=3448133 RepID=UPI003EDEC834